MTSARDIAIALGGKRAQRCGDVYLTCCPVATHGQGRGDRTPSLAIKDGNSRLLVRCFGGCEPAAVLAELRRRGLLGGAHSGPRIEPPTPRPQAKARSTANSDTWRAIWNEAVAPHGTPVQAYLAGRGLSLPPLANDVIRFHGGCPFGKDGAGRTIRTPAMIALVRNVISNKAQAVHRTALDATGRKIEVAGCDRMALGPIEGGAVKLTADEDVSFGLGIAEGVETALSLQRLPEWAGSPVWSLLHRHGVSSFPLLARIETLAIAVDHDPPGEAAAREVTRRWHQAAREVLVFEANRAGADLNDVICE